MLICRQCPDSLRWEVALSADDESGIEAVEQNGEPLESVNGEWPLSSFAGCLSIEFADRQPAEIALFSGDPLVFKLSRDWKGYGRRIRRVTKGHFILIAPTEWPREGHVPVEPAGCMDSAFTAHYFFRGGSESADGIGGFAGHPVALGASGFELTGESIFDDSEEGDLFVGTPPQLNTTDGVVWARVGEEKQDGWSGENFKPAERTLAEVLSGRQGRFFVRVYSVHDDSLELLDSDQFRYLHNLQEILVDNAPYTRHTLLVPQSSGHHRTTVQFIGAVVHSIACPDTAYLEESDSALVVQPHPDADTLSCDLRADGGCAGIVLNLPRIWWRMEKPGQSESGGEWCDTALEMTRHEFREYADENAILRLRLPERIKSFSVGFGDEVERTYLSKKNCLEFPLGDFRDYEQIDCRLPADALFNVRLGQDMLTLIRISADPTPAIVSFTCEPTTVIAGERSMLRWSTQETEDVVIAIQPTIGAVDPVGCREITPLETTTWTLRLISAGREDLTSRVTVRVYPAPDYVAGLVAHVRSARGGRRRGKGFSQGELRACGLTEMEAMGRSIRIDKRRRSTHPSNVEALRRMTDA